MSYETTATKKPSSFNTLTIIVLIVLVISLAGNVFYFVKAKNLKGDIAEQQEANDKLKVDMVSLSETITTLNENQNDLQRKITDKDILIQRLGNENTTLNLIKTQLEEIQKISTEFNLSNDKLKIAQEKMRKTIEARQSQNKQLSDDLKKQ